MRKSRVLPEREIIGQVFLELIADHLLFSRETIHGGIAREQTTDTAERCIPRFCCKEESLGPGWFQPCKEWSVVSTSACRSVMAREIVVIGGEGGLGFAALHGAEQAIVQFVAWA